MSSLTILYGSQTGTSERLSYRLGRYALLGGAERVRVLPADDVPLDQWASLSPILLVCSNANQGDAPWSIKNTWRTLLASDAPYLDGLFFAVFGVGDSLYEKFNYMPKMLHNRLVQRHAIPLCSRGLGDESDPHGIEEGLVPWLQALWTTLGWGSIFTSLSSPPPSDVMQHLAEDSLPLFPLYVVQRCPAHAGASPSDDPLPKRTREKKQQRASTLSSPRCRRADHFVGEVIENTRLTAKDHFQAVHHLKIALSSPCPPTFSSSSSSSGSKGRMKKETTASHSTLPPFFPGDALGVFVSNGEALVNQALQVLGYTGEEVVVVKPRHGGVTNGVEVMGSPTGGGTSSSMGKTKKASDSVAPREMLSSLSVPSAGLPAEKRKESEIREKEQSAEAYDVEWSCSPLGFEQHTHSCLYDHGPMSLRELLTHYVDLEAVVSQDFLWMLSRLVIRLSPLPVGHTGDAGGGGDGDGGASEKEHGAVGETPTTFLTTTYPRGDASCTGSTAGPPHECAEENRSEALARRVKLEERAVEIQERLLELSNPAKPDAYLSYAHREKRNVVETLTDFFQSATVVIPCREGPVKMHALRRVPLDLFLSFSSWMRPRFFSISSSPTLDSTPLPASSSSAATLPCQTAALASTKASSSDAPPPPYVVHLTVAQLAWRTPMKRSRVGLCSTALTTSAVGFRVECCRWEGSLVLPEFPLPLLCIATGAGIAPIRSVIREWAARASAHSADAELYRKTPLYLYFGCRHAQKDFLYAKEWEAFQSSELYLPQLHVIPAFSRDGAKKEYVSHQLGEHATEIGNLLLRHLKEKEEDTVEPPVVVYVCGSAKQMPKDVSRTLRDILTENLKRRKMKAVQQQQKEKQQKESEVDHELSSGDSILEQGAILAEAENRANLLLQAMHYEGRYQVETWSS